MPIPKCKLQETSTYEISTEIATFILSKRLIKVEYFAIFTEKSGFVEKNDSKNFDFLSISIFPINPIFSHLSIHFFYSLHSITPYHSHRTFCLELNLLKIEKIFLITKLIANTKKW